MPLLPAILAATTLRWYAPIPESVKGPFKGLAAIGGIPAPEPLGMPRGRPTTLLLTGAGASKAWGHPLTSELPAQIKRLSTPHPDPRRMMRECQELLAYAETSNAFGNPFDFEDYCSWLVASGIEDDVGWWSKRDLPAEDEPENDAEFHYRMTMWCFWLALLATDRVQQGKHALQLPALIPPEYASLERQFGTIAAVVTMNYDMVPEHLLANRGIDYGYKVSDLLVAETFQEARFDMKASHEQALATLTKAGFGKHLTDEVLRTIRWQDYMRVGASKPFEPGMLPVLKLHGSLNMSACPKCRKVIVYPPYLRREAPAQWLFPGWELANVRSTGFMGAFHCGEPDGSQGPPNSDPNRLSPVAIPPIANKEEHPAWHAIAQVHERAIAEAGKAERVAIIGTSLRPSDRILSRVLNAINTRDVTFVGDAQTFKRLHSLIPTAKHLRTRL